MDNKFTVAEKHEYKKRKNKFRTVVFKVSSVMAIPLFTLDA